MDDLYYGDVFALPYWNYFNLSELEPEKRIFIRKGCLIFVYAMISEVLNGTGAYLTIDSKRFSDCKNEVKRLIPEDAEEELIVPLLLEGINLIDNKYYGLSILDENSQKVHELFVRKYYREVTNDFNTNPYFIGNPKK